MNKTMCSQMFIAFTLSIALLSACSHTVENRKLDQEITKAPEVKNSDDLGVKAKELLVNYPNLSSDQKDKLSTLVTSTQSQMSSLREESLKLRELLIEKVSSPEYDKKEVSQIKARLKNVEDKRLNTIFDSVDQVNTILGRTDLSKKKLMHDVINLHEKI